MEYLIYTPTGWVTKHGTRHSDHRHAATYSRAAAIELCQTHVDHEGRISWIPVQKFDLEELTS